MKLNFFINDDWYNLKKLIKYLVFCSIYVIDNDSINKKSEIESRKVT